MWVTIQHLKQCYLLACEEDNSESCLTGFIRYIRNHNRFILSNGWKFIIIICKHGTYKFTIK